MVQFKTLLKSAPILSSFLSNTNLFKSRAYKYDFMACMLKLAVKFKNLIGFCRLFILKTTFFEQDGYCQTFKFSK